MLSISSFSLQLYLLPLPLELFFQKLYLKSKTFLKIHLFVFFPATVCEGVDAAPVHQEGQEERLPHGPHRQAQEVESNQGK